MDTKWKKSKRWIGFTAFFLGLTLFLGNLLHIIAMIAGGITTEDMKDAFQPDYQNTSAFQFYMEGYLEDFLSMASGGKVDFPGITTAYKGDFLQQLLWGGILWIRRGR